VIEAAEIAFSAGIMQGRVVLVEDVFLDVTFGNPRVAALKASVNV